MVELSCELNDLQCKVLKKLGELEEGWHVNQLVMELQLPYNEVAAELMLMELNGLVKGAPGGVWRRVER